MKRFVAAVLILAFVALGAAANDMDFVVLLDVSESMFPFFDRTVDSLIRDILEQHLTSEDTFHLLSFANAPEVELTRQIRAEEDIEDVLARILLLQPLGQYTDLVRALRFLQSYVSSLDQRTSKKILVLTDGIHDPPPGSLYPLDDAEGYGNVLRETADTIRREGWDITLMQFPRDGESQAEQSTDVDDTTQGAGDSQGLRQPYTAAEDVDSEEAPDTVPATIPGMVESEADETGATESSAAEDADASEPDADARAGNEELEDTAGREPAGSDESVEPTVPVESDRPVPERDTTSDDVASDDVASDDVASDDVASDDVASDDVASDDVASDDVASDDVASDDVASDDRGDDIYPGLSKDLDVGVIEYREPDESLSHEVLRAPEVVFPDDLGRVRRSFSIPLTIRNYNAERVMVKLAELVLNGENILRRPVTETIPGGRSGRLKAPVSLPDSIAPGPHTVTVTLGFTDDLRVYPRKGEVTFTLVVKTTDWNRALRILGYVVAGLVAAALLWAVVVFLRNVFERSASAAGTSPPVRTAMFEPGERPIEMVVENQNSNIGSRNVHVIRDGARRSVGGGRSAFRVYLYPVPGRVAEIERHGDDYSFIPNKAEYCKTNTRIDNCLRKPIELISRTGRRIRVLFRPYVSRLEQINRIMHLTDSPGRPKDSDWD